jgi:hypothetical protein
MLRACFDKLSTSGSFFESHNPTPLVLSLSKDAHDRWAKDQR